MSLLEPLLVCACTRLAAAKRCQMRRIEVVFSKISRAAHSRALPGRIDAHGDLGTSKTAKMAPKQPQTGSFQPT